LEQEARRACRKLLQLQRLKRRVQGKLEFPCSGASYAGETSPMALALDDQGTLHSPQVGF
jgi:hypothetical protein